MEVKKKKKLFLPLACLLQVLNIETGGEKITKHQLRK